MLLNWLDTLLDYDFKVIHRPGLDMLLPDTLSRIYASNTLSDSTHISSSPLLRINALSMNELVSYPDTELRTFVANRFDLRFVPVGKRQALLTQAHVNGHFGSDHLFRTLWLSGVFWPSMRRDCISHVSTCLPCLRFNVGKRGYHPQRVITAKFPFQHIAVDTITGFKTTNRGNNCILVITDICTRFSLIIAQPTWQALDTARSLWSVLCTFPLPQIIQSDNGPEYVNKVIRALTTLLGIDHRLVAPYNPRANGSAENRVGLCQRILRKLTNGDLRDWDLFLPAVQLAMNSKINPSTKSAPMSLVFNMPTSYFTDYRNTNSFLSTEDELLQRASDMHKLIYPTIAQNFSNHRNKRTAAVNARKNIVPPLAVGAKVMLRDPRRSSKHQPTWYGPFTVVSKSRGGTYTLQNPDLSLLRRPVPRDQLKLISADVVTDDVFYVEKILDHRGPENQREFLVKWLNYPSSENTWEPASNIIDTKVLRDYWVSHAALPATPSTTALPVTSENAALPASPADAARSAHNIQDFINAALPASSIHAALPASSINAALPASSINAALPASFVNAALPASFVNAALPVSQAHAALPAPPAAASPAMYVPTVSKSRYGRLRIPKRT